MLSHTLLSMCMFSCVQVYPHIGLLVKPYSRATPYILGFILAYWLNAMGGEVGIANISKPSLIRRSGVLAIAFVLLLTALFGGLSMQYDNNDGGQSLKFTATGVSLGQLLAAKHDIVGDLVQCLVEELVGDASCYWR